MNNNFYESLGNLFDVLSSKPFASATVTTKLADAHPAKVQSVDSHPIQPPKPGFVRNLRRAGFKIRIKHFRLAQLAVNPGFENGPAGIHLVTKENRKQYSHIASNGGMTEVDVTFPDGITTVGSAICCAEDTYNKRLGVYIAFQRAVEMRKKLAGK